MVIVLISVASFVLGFIALREMLVWERSTGSPLLPLSFAYFLPQHLAFGFGGFLIAIFGEDLYYSTLHGSFPYADGLIRLALIHVLSLVAGLAGVRMAMTVRRFMVRQEGLGPLASQGDYLSEPLAGQNRTLRKLCYASLALHAVVIGLQWYWAYFPVDRSLRYLIDAVAGQVAPATFFFWGTWWRKARHQRVVFAAYFAVFCVLTLAGKGRGPVVFAVLLFVLGYLSTSGRSLLRPRWLIVASASGTLLVWLFVMSGELVRIYHVTGERRPATFEELIERVGGLFGGVELGGDEAGLFRGAVVLFSKRIYEWSALDVVARTPEWVPYSGWPADHWLVLATGWLPVFLFPNLPSTEGDGPIILREYGFLMPSEDPGGMPVTLLADSWRRFGWFGVAGFHFLWALFLSGVSVLIGRRRLRMRRLLFAGAVLAIVSTLYTTSLLALITSLPRRFVLCLGYGIIVGAICNLRPKANPHAAMSGLGIGEQRVQGSNRESR